MKYEIQFTGYITKHGTKPWFEGYQKRSAQWVDCIPEIDEVFELPIYDKEPKEENTAIAAVYGVFVVTCHHQLTILETPGFEYDLDDYPLDPGSDWSDKLQKDFYEEVKRQLQNAVSEVTTRLVESEVIA